MSLLPTGEFNRLASDFDRFLPQIHPVTLALLDKLPAPAGGAAVLDVACGTGEPGLTLLRGRPEVRLLGVDQAEAMVAVARGKAARESLTNAHFEVMSSESLALPAASVDAAISRFGLLMFGDVPASARELCRVLRPGGHFSVAVWDDAAGNTLMGTASERIRARLPASHPSPWEALLAWAGEARPQALREAGIGEVHSEAFTWSYRFDSFEEAWELVSRMGSFSGQALLAAEVQAEVKEEVRAALAEFRDGEGRMVIPHRCRLIWGKR